MVSYRYSILARFIYRYANLILTPLLLVYTILSLYLSFEKWYLFLVFLLNSIILIKLNRFYWMMYRNFPFQIDADNEAMICSDYLFGKKRLRIEFKEIDKISGGLLSGMTTRPIYIHCSKRNIKFGFYSHLKDFNKLLKVILQNVNQELYDEILEKLKQIIV